MLLSDHLLVTLARMAALADRWLDVLGAPDAPLVVARTFDAQTLEHELARVARELPSADALVRLLDREPGYHATIARLVPLVSSALWKAYGRAHKKVPRHLDMLAEARAHLRLLKAQVRSTAPTAVHHRAS